MKKIAANRTTLIVSVLLLPVLFAAGLALNAWLNPEGWAQVQAELGLQPGHGPSGIMASGFIEGEEVRIASETGGRVVEVAVEEGGEVEEGDLLVRLDTTYLDSQVEAAQAAVEVARANLKQAQVAVDVTYLQWKSAVARRSHAEAIALDLQLQVYEAAAETAQAQVEQAEAELAVLETQRDKLTLRSPLAGVVVEKMVQEGEVVLAASPLLVVANLDVATLVLYIPESKLGLINLGQDVEVSVDSFPGEVFPGELSYISPQAEFTPTGVQTQEERVKMVFRIKVTIPNPEHKLKPGMPADAVILLEAESD